MKMLRIFSFLSRGLRSVKPNQYYSQDPTDDTICKYNRYVSNIPAAQLRFSSTISRNAVFWKENLNPGVKYQRHVKKINDGTRIGVIPELENEKPPWQWQSLLDQYSEETKHKERHENDDESSQDWERKCHNEQLILKHSILQGLGWGSAVALTWSVYRDGKNNNYCPFTQKTYRYNESPTDYHIVSIRKPDVIYHYKSPHKTYCENCSRPDGENCKSDCLKNLDGADNFYWYGKPEYTSKIQTKVHHFKKSYNGTDDSSYYRYCNSDISWRINSKPPLVKKKGTGKCRELVKETNVNSFQSDISSDSEICDIENSINTSYKFEIKETLNDERDGFFEKAALYFHKDGIHNYKFDSGCGSDCSNNTNSDEVVEKQINSNDDKEVSIQQISSSTCTSSGDLRFRTIETQTSDPIETQCKKVLVEDCPEDDYIDSKETSSHQNVVGINNFSDSLLEILAAGKEEIQCVQDQFEGVLESDIGVTMAEKNPEQAVIFFRAGALLGNPSSIFNLALCYHTGRGVTQDFVMARQLYEASSLAGHGWGTYNLAVMISRGEGGAVDTEQAYKLLILAAERGVKEAQDALSQCHHHHICEKQDKLMATQSEPNLAATTSYNMRSSYSTTDLLFMMDESDNIELCSNSSTDIIHLDDKYEKPYFHL